MVRHAQGWKEVHGTQDKISPPQSLTCTVPESACRSAWARLIARVYEIDPLICPRCSSKMRVLAVIIDPTEAKKNLRHLIKIGDVNWKNALDCYQRAHDADPGNTHALLALARVDQEMQNYADAKASYDKLKAADPALAREYSFLGEGKEGSARAADVAAERKKMLWEMTE